MQEFKSICLEDKALFNRYFESINYRICDFSFANLFCWQPQYQTSYAIIDNFLVIQFTCDDGLPCYMMPVGEGNMRELLLKLIHYSKNKNERFRIHAITIEMFELLNSALPTTFLFKPLRDYFEYIYLSSDLIELKGKKYQQKRNHINRFKIQYPSFVYQSMSLVHISACKELYEKWMKQHLEKNPDSAIQGEKQAVFRALDNFLELELEGGCLFVDGVLVAFTMGQAVTQDTFVVYIEKALNNYQGAYQVINNQFLLHEASKYTFVNREEDLGIPALRQAKMSYHPYKFLERGSVCLK